MYPHNPFWYLKGLYEGIHKEEWKSVDVNHSKKSELA